MDNFGESRYRVETSKFIKTPILYCKHCDLFRRIVSNEVLTQHYYAAGYVQLQNEKEYWAIRKNFYFYLMSIIKRYKQDVKTILDIGCSYGHFLKILQEHGYKVWGVEINKVLLEILKEREFKVYEKINDVPTQLKFDCITLIDSFYYFDSALDALHTLKKLLNPQALLIMRLINRNWWAKFSKNVLRRKNLDCLGDAIFSYSVKSISKILEEANFKIKGLIFVEKGKGMSFKKEFFTYLLTYLLTYLFTYLTLKKVIFSPGIIVIAEKKN